MRSPASSSSLLALGLRFMRWREQTAYGDPTPHGTAEERLVRLEQAVVEINATAQFLGGALRIDWEPEPQDHPVNVERLAIIARLHVAITELAARPMGSKE